MSRKESVLLTNMCLIYKDDEILVQERTKNDWPGLTFPGGHIKKNENFNKRISCQWQVMSYRVQFLVACDDSATPIL